MTAAPAIKGWCPTLLSPMQSGDGWLARVKPHAAMLGADAVRLLADGARRYGNGHIDLTARGNLQVRGLNPRSAELFAEAIIGAGLACADPAVEAVRNVMASPLGWDDPTSSFDSHALAREIEGMLASEPELAALPDKFGILVDGGGILPLGSLSADIMLAAQGKEITVRVDGGALAARCSLLRAAASVRALALASLHLAWERREAPCRMRVLIKKASEETIFALAGLEAVPAAAPSAEAGPVTGFIPWPGGSIGAVGVGLPFGRIEADALAALASLCEHFGDGTLRTTPWRAFLIVGVEAGSARDIGEEVARLGLIGDPADPRLRIFACVGAPSCRSGHADARGDANRIAAFFSAAGADTLHVSGCAKSCAHRGSASLTLVGREGGYDVVRDGAAGDRTSLTGLRIEDAIALLQAAKGART